jgi:protein-arginine kinase activator protein McsA
MLEKFRENYFSLNEIIKNNDDLLNFLLDKKAFNENFMELICDSNELTKLTNVRKNKTSNFKIKDYFFDISKIDNEYKIGYDKKNKKITVDISGNTIFSYYDDNKTLKQKLEEYVHNEEYEKADVIHNYIKKCQM